MNNTSSERMGRRFAWRALAAAVLCLSAGLNPSQTGASRPAPAGSSAVLSLDYGRIPLSFIPNEGQTSAQAAYYVQGRDQTIFFGPDGLTLILAAPPAAGQRPSASGSASPPWVVKLDFVEANPGVRIAGEERAETVISYFQGPKAQWRTGLHPSSRIVYQGLWPGIDLAYSGTVNRMKYEFIVHPGADPSCIKLAYRGVDKIAVSPSGHMDIVTPVRTIRDEAPVGYQTIDGRRVDVPLAFSPGPDAAAASEHVYGFSVGEFDRTRDLILDPATLVYCGFIGGFENDYGNGIAVDSGGYVYVGGSVNSNPTTFPETVGPFLTYGGSGDAFVAKINPAGNTLVFCGYLGGSAMDYCYGIAVDTSGNVYLAGDTMSGEASFPVTVGPDLTFNGLTDAWVAKVNASGTSLAYCGYIGGMADDGGNGIAVDSNRCAYITGNVQSTAATFPVAVGPDLTYNGGYDAYVAKVQANGQALAYCGYIGGAGDDIGYEVVTDGSASAYVVGRVNSSEATFPVAAGPDLTYNGGGYDAFLAKISASGAGFIYCGYVGGSGDDLINDVDVDSSGRATIAGRTSSTESSFPVAGGPDLSANGGVDAFVARVNASGTGFEYSGFIGGSAADYAMGVAVDANSCAHVTGYTSSSETSFPVKNGLDATHNGWKDAFVAKVTASGDGLKYCGYIGGGADDRGIAIAVDTRGNAYITGDSNSSEATFPETVGPDLSANGGADAIVAKINPVQNDLVGTWDGQGVYYRNSATGLWTMLATPADMIASGDLNGDGVDDLIGIWASQAGVWIRSSAGGTWSYLSSSARHIASGDMNGDGRADFLGTWDGQGVYYRDSIGGSWMLLASPATLITAGDLDGDAKADLIGIWPSQAGVWVKYSLTGSWTYLGSSARDMTTGDMNGDGRTDLVGTWDGQGVYYRDSISGQWTQIATPADQITAGDLDGDSKDDLIGIWAGQAGVWVKYSLSQTWSYIGSSARDICSGRMAEGSWSAGAGELMALVEPAGGSADGPGLSGSIDFSAFGPGGGRFVFQAEPNLIPHAFRPGVQRIAGPGEPGFRPKIEKNLSPPKR